MEIIISLLFQTTRIRQKENIYLVPIKFKRFVQIQFHGNDRSNYHASDDRK